MNKKIKLKASEEDNKKMESLFNEYVKENGVTPFIDMDFNEETGEITIDFDADFEKKLYETFGTEENVKDVMGDFITQLIDETLKALKAQSPKD